MTYATTSYSMHRPPHWLSPGDSSIQNYSLLRIRAILSASYSTPSGRI
ncbi:hypothetical protein A2U01_0109323, partial [Trifolium medium]|nr:hypothetical protein [Trifolium medium]